MLNGRIATKLRKDVGCEIEVFVEAHLCKACAIRRSRALRVLYGLMRNIHPVLSVSGVCRVCRVFSPLVFFRAGGLEEQLDDLRKSFAEASASLGVR